MAKANLGKSEVQLSEQNLIFNYSITGLGCLHTESHRHAFLARTNLQITRFDRVHAAYGTQIFRARNLVQVAEASFEKTEV